MLGHNFPGVEFHKHRPVCFELFHWNGEAEIIQNQELKLKVVELDQGKSSNLFPLAGTQSGEEAAYLGVSRISIKNIRKEFASTGHASDDQSVDIKAIDNEEL